MCQLRAFTRNPWQGKGHADGVVPEPCSFLFYCKNWDTLFLSSLRELLSNKDTMLCLVRILLVPSFRFFMLLSSENRQLTHLPGASLTEIGAGSA